MALVSTCVAQTVAAQNIYYDKPTNGAKAEIQAWGQMYHTLQSTGTPAAGAASFSFTNSTMNGSMFSPLRAAQWTGMTLGSSMAVCPGDVASSDISGLLIEGVAASNVATEPEKTIALLEMAISEGDVGLALEDEVLVASNVSATIVTGSVPTSLFANANTTISSWIAQLMSATVNFAQGTVTSDDARRRVMGTERAVDAIEDFVKRWSWDQGVSVDTYQVEARFGRYGALPLVIAYYEQDDQTGFVIVDGINGNVDGPFVAGSSINPVSLLAAHSNAYVSGSGVTVVHAGTGCMHLTADTKKPYAPTPTPGTVPPPLIPIPGRPAAPATPTTPAIPAIPTGRPSSWSCTTDASGACVCTSTYNYDLAPGSTCPVTPSNGGCKVKVTIKCTSTGGGGITGGACRSVPNTTPAPAAPTAPLSPPPTGFTCTEEWWYWG